MALACGQPLVSEAEGLLALYEAKARAELSDADAVAGVGPAAWRGEVMAAVALVIGATGEDGAGPLAGDAGEAGAKALAALGFPEGTVFVIASRPPCAAGGDAIVRRLRLAIEAVDPTLVLALDAAGAQDLAGAFGLPELAVGWPVSALGRTFGYAGDFAAALGDDVAKGRVWAAMKAVARAHEAGTSTRRPKAPRKGSDPQNDRPKA